LKAIQFHEYGGAEVLRYEEVPDPVLREDEVLVRVRACALNHLDIWLRKGVGSVPLPHINGSDVAGEVVKVGKYVDGIAEGQRVVLAPMVYCGQCRFCMSGLQNQCKKFSVLGNRVNGGNCELLAARRDTVIPIPDSLSFEQAACLPLVFITAWHMLVTRAGVRPGQRVLVWGANSGVGSAAIQIAKLFGAEVIATAGSEAKLAKARELGAGFAVHHYQEKVSAAVKQHTLGEMVDIVFEHPGQATWGESMKSLKPGGTIVTCGATSGPKAEIDLRFLYSRQLSYLGSYMGTMGDLHSVLEHAFRGSLKPVMDRTFPLAEAPAAHQLMESSEMFGKIVLRP
jgi:NADPH:quinone reductase-like Zn-dependent oxidoreductase